MKNTLISSLFFLLAAFTGFSCSENGEDEDEKATARIQGKWYYSEPHFVCEYPEDSLRIQIKSGDKTIVRSIAIAEIKTGFTLMAHDKMGSYFKGLDLISASSLKVVMNMDSMENTLGASYVYKDDLLKVQLDTAELHALTGLSMNIPAISFSCLLGNSDTSMTLYMDKTYLQVLYSTMGKMLTPMLTQMADQMLPASIPAAVRPMAVKAAVQQMEEQIPVILSDFTKLEIGMKMTRTQIPS